MLGIGWGRKAGIHPENRSECSGAGADLSYLQENLKRVILSVNRSLHWSLVICHVSKRYLFMTPDSKKQEGLFIKILR